MASWHGALLQVIDLFWKNIRSFAFYNRTLFELTFVILYALEQIALLWFTFHTSNLQELSYIISLFAIIVLTTFAIHKLVMESRIKFLENEVQNTHQEKLCLELKFKEVERKYTEMVDAVMSQDLYSSKNSSIRKRNKK